MKARKIIKIFQNNDNYEGWIDDKIFQKVDSYESWLGGGV